jgi:hypothetical protein
MNKPPPQCTSQHVKAHLADQSWQQLLLTADHSKIHQYIVTWQLRTRLTRHAKQRGTRRIRVLPLCANERKKKKRRKKSPPQNFTSVLYYLCHGPLPVKPNHPHPTAVVVVSLTHLSASRRARIWASFFAFSAFSSSSLMRLPSARSSDTRSGFITKNLHIRWW